MSFEFTVQAYGLRLDQFQYALFQKKVECTNNSHNQTITIAFPKDMEEKDKRQPPYRLFLSTPK